MPLIVPRPKAPTGEVKFENLVDLLAPQGEERRPRRTLPAEWAPQSGVQITWPHAGTDWAYMLDEVTETYVRMAYEIAVREPLLIVTPEPEAVRFLLDKRLPAEARQRITYFECATNDTWARDHGFITLLGTDGPELLDFRFNGWGGKFEAALDNAINAHLAAQPSHYHSASSVPSSASSVPSSASSAPSSASSAPSSASNPELCSATRRRIAGRYTDYLDFELEGGAIESDGQGTLLTTAECLLNANRRHDGDAVPTVDKDQVELLLRERLGVERILWLDHGYLAGDDTDSHIDTLARLCPGDVIVYVKCTDPDDEHFEALRAMEDQLRTFRTREGSPYTLIPVPLPHPCYDNDDDNDNDDDAVRYDDSASPKPATGPTKGERLPATYANFLIMNDAVLLPVYNQPDRDAEAIRQMQEAFPHHEIVPIDCRSLIRQHGSLHCCTMQFPRGVLQEQ